MNPCTDDGVDPFPLVLTPTKHQTENKSTYFFNFKLVSVTSKQSMVNAKGSEEDPREIEGLVCSLSTFGSIPPSPYQDANKLYTLDIPRPHELYQVYQRNSKRNR